MAPEILSPIQNASQMNICADILKTHETDPTHLERVIKCDESCFVTWDPETKQQ